MSELKQQLKLRVISNAAAKNYLDRNHPLGSGQAYLVAFGVIYEDKLCGVLTFGNPIASGATKFVELKQSEVLELRKMHVTDAIPNMGESRILAIATRLIFKQYKRIQICITYCDESEAASGYRGAGWQPAEAHTYVSEIEYNGRWYTARDASRLGLTKKATNTKTASRRKWWIARDQETFVRLKSVIESRSNSTSKKLNLPLTGNGEIG